MCAGNPLGHLPAEASTQSPPRYAAALANFEKEFRGQFQHRFTLLWWMKHKIPPRLCDMVIRAWGKDGRLSKDLTDLLIGSARHVKIGTMLRAFARNYLPFFR